MSIAVFISVVTGMGPYASIRTCLTTPAGERSGGSPAVILEKS
ncbi:hypothetical protein [Mycolicibacterium peregrinum]|nr:hypothetical protein [Mycolicibacterium peregrinum]